MTKFVERMIRDGKTTQAKVAAKQQKEAKVRAAKEKYKAEKATLKKADFEKLLDDLTA